MFSKPAQVVFLTKPNQTAKILYACCWADVMLFWESLGYDLFSCIGLRILWFSYCHLMQCYFRNSIVASAAEVFSHANKQTKNYNPVKLRLFSLI